MSAELAMQRWLKNLGHAFVWWLAPPIAWFVDVAMER